MGKAILIKRDEESGFALFKLEEVGKYVIYFKAAFFQDAGTDEEEAMKKLNTVIWVDRQNLLEQGALRDAEQQQQEYLGIKEKSYSYETAEG